MNRSTLESFFYEVLAYVIPGFLIIHVALTWIVYSHTDSVLFLRKLLLVPYSFGDFLGIVVASGIVGMILTLITTMSCKLRVFHYLKNQYGLYYYIVVHPEKSPLGFSNALKPFLLCLGVDLPLSKLQFLSLSDELDTLINRFLEENSNVINPLGRYFSRQTMAKNLALSILLTTLFLGIHLRELSTFSLFLVVISGSSASLLLIYYAFKQSIWRCQYTLLRLIAIQNHQMVTICNQNVPVVGINKKI